MLPLLPLLLHIVCSYVVGDVSESKPSWLDGVAQRVIEERGQGIES